MSGAPGDPFRRGPTDQPIHINGHAEAEPCCHSKAPALASPPCRIESISPEQDAIRDSRIESNCIASPVAVGAVDRRPNGPRVHA
jgi:hypothetical protein